MRLTALLADTAQGEPNGKVHAIGLGWTYIPSPAPRTALIVFLDPGIDEQLQPEYKVQCVLVDGNGEPHLFQTDGGSRKIVIDASIRSPQREAIPGGLVRMSLVVNIAPGLSLPVGQYAWQVTIVGTDVSAIVPFAVVAQGSGTTEVA